MTDVSIHSTSIVDPSARLGDGSSVGPYAIIGPHVHLGKNSRVGSHAVIEGHTKAGDNNVFFQFCSVGAQPQDLKYHGEPSTLELGDGNIVREFVTIQPGTEGGGMRTVIGDRNLFMANSHVGHDGRIGSHNVFANSAALAGHVTIGDRVTVGGLCGIHQFVRVGDCSILSGGSMVVKDIPPYCIGQGDRARLVGINTIGLTRAGISDDHIKTIRKAFRLLFGSRGEMSERIRATTESCGENEWVSQMIKFTLSSERGITPASRDGSTDDE